ncbi:DUF4259 domain-containing protein [Parasulfitobacter algicola]|uniref:DUF4259 domain-containing protein n=1 Tax=Parasulfitobacter algicola TaxID=2614809 RepID=A0ABX2IZ30_9RHOB|nr:DUF4259 domain-containing protein [Sulfitobacter algicola]NSX56605.1 DUF4259 domain-containing protein [Sulfitobacter algicola]
MGTWGIHSFDNDDAADLLAALEEADHPSDRVEAIREVFGAAFGTEYIDADIGATAVAGAEVIAAALGQPRTGDQADPFGLAASVKFYDDSLGMALAVLGQVRTDASELVELWDDSDEADDWRASLADLEARLRQAAKAHDLNPDFTQPRPGDLPDLAERLENKQISVDILEEYKAELEKLADQKKGDPSVEVLRQLGRKIFRMHNDITNLHYAITQSIDELSLRIDRLEGKGK